MSDTEGPTNLVCTPCWYENSFTYKLAYCVWSYAVPIKHFLKHSGSQVSVLIVDRISLIGWLSFMQVAPD